MACFRTVIMCIFVLLVSEVVAVGPICKAKLLAVNGTDLTWRDQHGLPTTDFSKAWGVPYTSCKKHCGSSYEASDWSSFSSAFTAWLLPFLALTAQLPFEARGAGPNIMAFFLAVGSPALITYSLTVTFLHNQWIAVRFRKLVTLNDQARFDIRSNIRAVEYILQQSQHVPIQIIQGSKGWLSSLIVLPVNKDWFERVRSEIESTSRPVTFSLVSQVLWVILAQLFTIVGAFTNQTGGTGVGLGMSSGCVWLWMIPVILGWVLVGTQNGHETIHRALRNGNKEICLATDDSEVQLRGFASGAFGAGTAIIDRRLGAQAHKMHEDEPHTLRTPEGSVYEASLSNESQLTSRNIGSGPKRTATMLDTAVSFLARTPANSQPWTTSRTLHRTITVHGKSSESENFKENRQATSSIKVTTSFPMPKDAVLESQTFQDLENEKITMFGGKQPPRIEEEAESSQRTFSFASSFSEADMSADFAKFLGMRIAGDEEQPGPIYNYARILTTPHATSHILRVFSNLTKRLTSPDGRRVDRKPWVRSGADSMTNLIGTDDQVARYVGLRLGDDLDVFPEKNPEGTGWRVFIASLVSMMLLWGATGSGVMTAYLIPVVGVSCRSGSWLIYGALATVVWAMLIISAALSSWWSRRNWMRLRAPMGAQPPSTEMKLIGAIAVLLRVTAKVIAVFNTFWIIMTSFFQYTGIYNNCWCDSVVPFLGTTRAWALVFATPDQIAAAATPALVSGLVLSMVTLAITSTFFIVIKSKG